MDREELGVALLLSLPVAVGVAVGVLKQTLGSQPLVAAAAGLGAGGLVFGLVTLAGASGAGRAPPARVRELAGRGLRDLGGRVVPEARAATRMDLLMGASMGALLSVFLWYIPLSPLLGGAAAGFLQGSSRRDARTAGALSGALVPVVVLLFAVGAFLVAGAQVFGRFPFGPLVASGLAVVGVVYAVGLGTVGGWLGGLALEDERRWGSEV